MHANSHQMHESARHQSAIDSLARETRAEPAYVRQLLEHELANLEANAKVRGYLYVLASRRVRSAIHKARNGTAARHR